ncbi:hypothetical protein RDI58_018009 [Solanum bulbocastanum]|uniref:Uncharacterized protein n=1 Tax=Solanum bulbocastanum TaxID=147425 RepID=A0AAN8Y9C8_SOLBU
MEKKLLNEFKEPSSKAIIAFCLKEMTKFTWSLMSEKGTTPAAVALTPIKEKPWTSQNVKGANSASFRRQCEAMVKNHKPTMLVLLETRMSEHKRLTKVFNFDS